MANYSPKLNIVLFNTDSSDKGIKAPYRYRCMDVILDTVIAEKYPNLFILAQDKIKRPKHRKLCVKLHQDYTRVTQREEAGVYFNNDTNRHYDVKYVDVGILQQTEDALVLEANNVFTVSRLTACVLTPKAGVIAGKKILLVSWHGPYKLVRREGNPNPRKQNLRARRRCFLGLVRFLDKLKNRRGCVCDMVIVGGDFNLPSGKARDLLGGVRGALLDNYIPTKDRPANRDPIDYVVYWPRDGLEDIEIAVLRRDLRGEKKKRPFDHNILLYRFGDRFSDLARQFASITVYDDEEESDNAEDNEESDDAEDEEGSDNAEDEEGSNDAAD